MAMCLLGGWSHAPDGWAASRVLGRSLGESLGRAGKCRVEAQKRVNVGLVDVPGQESNWKFWVPCAGEEGSGHKDAGDFLSRSAVLSLTSFMPGSYLVSKSFCQAFQSIGFLQPLAFTY